MKKRDLPVFVLNHQDLTWRRCFNRPLEHKGESYVSYAHLQALYIKENLRLLEKYPEYRFSIECVATLENFLGNNPEYEEKIKKYLDEDRIHIPFTGHNIVDSNLISGESIVRSYLFGYNYLKNKFGYVSEGFDRNDSFGNSAQLPQIARGFGQKFCNNVVYTNLEGNYWRGLDGSTLANIDPTQSGICGGYAKYRPCPVCHGKGDETCPECGGKLIDVPYAERRRFRIGVDYDSPQREDLQGYLYISGEELLPTEEMFDWMEANRDKYNIYFTNCKELAHRYYADRLEKVDCPPEDEIHPSCEVNCNNTGTYVSRIKAKQNVRNIESRIYGLEALSVMNALSGKKGHSVDTEALWSKILFTMFHDAVTGTMVDAAYDELCDVHSEIDEALKKMEAELLTPEELANIITIVNPYGQEYSGEVTVRCPEGFAPVTEDGKRLSIIKRDGELSTVLVENLPPFSTLVCTLCEYKEEKFFHKFQYAQRKGISAVLRNEVSEETEKASGETFVIENEFYKITAESHGILEIFDKQAEKAVFKAGKYKIGELILEHDEGSPWATLSTDQRRMPMSDVTFLVCFEKTEDYQMIKFSHTKKYWGYAVDAGYEVFYTVTLPAKEKKVYFSADVDWDTQNHRIRVAFPTPLSGRSMYEIPYGVLERKPYEPNMVWPHGPSNWAGASGDYPAIGFAGVEGEGAAVALFNKGTPSYKIEEEEDGKTILLSLVRSPSVGTYLHEPESYSMTAYDEMRDPGHHHFEYALTSYVTSFTENPAVTDARSYINKVYAVSGSFTLPEMPILSGEGVRISALKPASDENGFIMRLCEYHGKREEVTISVPAYVKAVEETDLKEEKIREITVENGKAALTFEPFKIKTLRFK